MAPLYEEEGGREGANPFLRTEQRNVAIDKPLLWNRAGRRACRSQQTVSHTVRYIDAKLVGVYTRPLLDEIGGERHRRRSTSFLLLRYASEKVGRIVCLAISRDI